MNPSTWYRKGAILATCLLLFSSASAQNEPVNTVQSEDFEAKHIIKTNLISYLFYSINANYEYKTGASTSIGLLGGYKLPQTIHVDAIAELSEGAQTYSGDIDPEGFFINPYFRFYAQEALEGFYIEGFLRYYDFTYKVPYDYEKNDQTISALANGEAQAWGGGIGFGSQINLAPKWYLDINLGLGLSKGDIHMETNDPNLDADDYADIKENIESHKDTEVDIFLLSSILEDLEAGADDHSAWADINNSIFPIIRAGICIGFAF